jgi:hypothetical protein
MSVGWRERWDGLDDHAKLWVMTPAQKEGDLPMEPSALKTLVDAANNLYEDLNQHPGTGDELTELESTINGVLFGAPAWDPASYIEVPEGALLDAAKIVDDPRLYEEWLDWEIGLLEKAGLESNLAETVEDVLREEREEIRGLVFPGPSPAPGVAIKAVQSWVGNKLKVVSDAAGTAITRVLGSIRSDVMTRKRAVVILTGGIVGIADATAGASIVAGATIFPPGLVVVGPGAIWLSQIVGGAMITNDSLREKIAEVLPG